MDKSGGKMNNNLTKPDKTGQIEGVELSPRQEIAVEMMINGFSDDEISEVKTALSLSPLDAFVIVIGDEKKAHAALSEVARRAAFAGIPEETRRANPDGTSSYMRPLPGKARLYPETDVAPIEITGEMLEAAKISIKKMEKK